MIRLLIFLLLLLGAARASDGQLSRPLVVDGGSGNEPGGQVVVSAPNMTRCYSETILCFYGDKCLQKRVDETTQHLKMVRLHHRNKTFQKQVEACNVVAIVEKTTNNTFRIVIKTNERNTIGTGVPFIVGSKSSSRAIVARAEKLWCNVGCKWTNQAKINDSGSLIYSGNLQVVVEKKRANFEACARAELVPYAQTLCYVGNGCLGGRGGPNSKIDLIRFDRPEATAILENCDVGAVLIQNWREAYEIEFHATAANFHLSIPLDEETFGFKEHLKIGPEGKLVCEPACILETDDHIRTSDFIYFKGYIQRGYDTVNSTNNGRKQANLTRCFGNDTLTCFVGNSCGNFGPDIDGITILSNETKFSKDSFTKAKVMKCDVGGTLESVPGERGVYKLDFHTTIESLQMEPKINIKSAQIGISRVSGKVECDPKCTYEDKRTRRWPLYWLGVLRIDEDAKSKTPASSGGKKDIDKDKKGGDDKDLRPNPLKKGESGDHEDGGSNMGTIFIACGCALVACIVVAIVVGTIIQRRHRAKNARRRVAIEKATSIANSTPHSAGNSSQRRKKGAASIPSMKTPLLDTTQASDDPQTEVTTSTRFTTQSV